MVAATERRHKTFFDKYGSTIVGVLLALSITVVTVLITSWSDLRVLGAGLSSHKIEFEQNKKELHQAKTDIKVLETKLDAALDKLDRVETKVDILIDRGKK